MIAAFVLAASVGYVDVQKLVTQHPLYPVLAQYDREIAAMRSTERVAGLRTIATSVRKDGDAIQAATAAANRRAQAMSAGNGAAYRSREQAYLSGMQSQRIPATDAAAFRSGASRSGQATLAAYRAATAQRTQRALMARAQQLREKETTLAFDLERSHAGQRLVVSTKLRNLHLDKAQRAALQAKLDALDASVISAVAARRRTDQGLLASYAAQLRAQENADNARMAATVARSTNADVAQHSGIRESLPPEADALRGYDPAAGASNVGNAIANAGTGLRGRFAQLQSVERTSRSDTDGRIAALQQSRQRLYDAIVTQIRNDASRIARERYMTIVIYQRAPSSGGVDLTAAVRKDLGSPQR
ncbi:MAG TPA: hypothetical protein VFE36_16845 [Candidatus Baltobacteraceae bacterium]|jgi:hypothetical protein|nr:hypothetical protein [Candidatus Baltobacteraceae bacterium]